MLGRVKEEIPWDLIELVEDLFDAHPKRYRDRGIRYHQQDRVILKSVSTLGPEFEFVVDGTRLYNVDIVFERAKLVTATCSCPVDEALCKHTAAAMLELLVQLETGVINASNTRQTDTKKAEPQNKPQESELAGRLQASTAKKLTKQQLKYISNINRLFQKLPPSGSVMGSEFNVAFSDQRFIPWERFTLWQTPPANDYELWLYLVHFAQKKRLSTPKFMDTLTDLAPIQDKLAVWARAIVVDEWNNLFSKTQIPVGINLSPERPPQNHELQLQFDRSGTTLLWRDDPDTSFKPISGPVLKALNSRLSSGNLTVLESRSELLFRRLENIESGRVKKTLDYDDYEAGPIFNNLLQSTNLNGMFISPTGSPYVFSNSSLRIHLSPTSTDPIENYQIKFMREKDQSVDGLIHIVQGNPSWALTETEILPIASLPDFDVSRFLKDSIVPAEAVESAQGILFFDRMPAQIPDVLSDRIQRTPLQLQIVCELEKAYREECLIYVTSTLPDGRPIGYWNGDDWVRHSKTDIPSPESPDKVVIFDDKALHQAAHVFDQIKTSFDVYKNAHKLAVTRKFPEIFSEWLARLPEGIDVALRGELTAFKDQSIVGRMQLEVKETEQDWFDLKVVLDVCDTDLSPDEINLLLAAHGKWVRLNGKGWRRIDIQLDDDEDLDFARLGINPNELSDEPQRFHALQLAAPAAKRLLPEAQASAIQKRAEDIQTRVTPSKPRSIKADMRPYQLEGFHFLSYLATNHFGGILADDMGLGKTLQALAWLVWLRQQKKTKTKSKPSLVVCPKSVMDNWQAEGEKFAPKLTIQVWTASTLAELPSSLAKADIHVINYNQLRSIGDAIRSETLLAVILDEGQYIKNPSSQTAKSACALKSEHRLVLTGTPIENRALDLWSLMTFAMPGVLGNRTQFGKLYDSKTDPLARLRLSSRVRPFLIRRTKSQVAQDLPERIEDEIHCELEGTQKKLYDAELKRAQQILLKAKSQKQLSKLRFNFLTSLLRLRQICAHPALFHKPSRAKSAKIEALLELLSPLMEENAKVLIFSQFVSLIEILEKELAKNDIKTWKLTGDTEDRGTLVKEFQRAPEPGAFLISLKAGGSGLNLTAASYVVLFDPWWNPAVEAQAIDRTHRIGQTSKIIAYRLIMKNTIEEKIRKLQQEKQALVQDVLGEEQFSQALTLKDFQFLLQE